MSIQYQIIYWRDIPTHVRVRLGRTRYAHALPEIFQDTVYRAAYRAKAITGDAYQNSWHTEGWLGYELDGSAETEQDKEQLLQQAALAVTAKLIADYNEERLDGLALNKGHNPQVKSGK